MYVIELPVKKESTAGKGMNNLMMHAIFEEKK